ncbi:UNVERIFIED_CONTAM: hypothetical protein PYX00_003034 [Menopon gallinae]|uniref:G-protein coupled receptors family 3 profile domain-containing protein n=1 Tax=Menopon gallinae TaxID=328185 RepID=A0AAW2HYF0_9NEOP
MGQSCLPRSLLIILSVLFPPPASLGETARQDKEEALSAIHDVATGNMGSLCLTENYRSVFVSVDTTRYDETRQKTDMAAFLLQELGLNNHRSGLPDALGKGLILSDRKVIAARILALNVSTGQVVTSVTWRRPSFAGGADAVALEINGPIRATDEDPRQGVKPDRAYPWYDDADTTPGLRSPKFMDSPLNASYKGWWTYPYYSCFIRKWLMSYSVAVPSNVRHGMKAFLSIDVDLSNLDVNQCETTSRPALTVEQLLGTHKCHNETTVCQSKQGSGWVRGGYQCLCRPGYYSKQRDPFNGTLLEAAWHERNPNVSYEEVFRCYKCAPGCHTCRDHSPCLATYNWPFRITLLAVSLCCVVFTLCLICYVFQHRRLKVFKVASPIFLAITLLGCAIMYLEMAAIFPVLDTYSCIATKWSRHLGFCITYTALLMKTWRVSLTYRVKSAHKVKLTDKQLLQWMFPILLVMLIYLGSWTLSDPPYAEEIKDQNGLRFKQCTFNWWDHSIAIGEVLFLAWGIRVCYNVRNAESFYNEAHLISYAIYNIAVVNIAMVAFHIFFFPQAGPDIKYLLGFIRTQLSTSVTVALVFGPKVARVWRGQGDQWDNRARARGVTASFSLNGIGLVSEETADLYQENEELKEEIQKLAGQIEFMKIVHMETNNRHLKPKTGGYFHVNSAQSTALQAPAKPKTYFGKVPVPAQGDDASHEESTSDHV